MMMKKMLIMKTRKKIRMMRNRRIINRDRRRLENGTAKEETTIKIIKDSRNKSKMIVFRSMIMRVSKKKTLNLVKKSRTFLTSVKTNP